MKEKYLHFDSIDSTSKYLKEHASQVDDFTFISSDYQTDGHGRNLRQWFSNKGENLLFSFIIKDKEIINHFPKLSIATAYVVAKYIQDKFKLSPYIKWPNDVFINNKKICGILLESTSTDTKIDSIIVGVGLNVNQKVFDNKLLKHPATSLLLETKKEIDILDLKQELFIELEKYLKRVNNDSSFIRYAQDHNYLKDFKVKLPIHNNKIGQVVGVNDDCSLRIKINSEIIDIISGEIEIINK